MTLTWAVVTNSDFSNIWLGLSNAWLAGGLAAPTIAGHSSDLARDISIRRQGSHRACHDRDAACWCST